MVHRSKPVLVVARRRIYDEVGLDEFTEVEPLPCTDERFVGKENPLPDDGETLPPF